MTLTIRQATRLDMWFVAKHMRDADREEIRALLFEHFGDVDAANDLFDMSVFKYTLMNDGKPVCAFGLHALRTSCWSAWMYATNDLMARGVVTVIEFAKEIILPLVKERGARRIECQSMATHTKAHRFIEKFGAYKEADLLQYGNNGETYFQYALLLCGGE